MRQLWSLRLVFAISIRYLDRRPGTQVPLVSVGTTLNRRKLAADHVWIARYHAKRLAGTIDYWELLSIGHLALVQAAKSWPGEKSFVPYATSKVVWKIRDAIKAAGSGIREMQETNWLNGHCGSSEKGIQHRRKDSFDPPDENEDPRIDGVYYVRDWIDRLPADEQRAVRMAYGIGTRKRNTVAVARAMKIKLRAAYRIIQSGLLRLRYMATCEQMQ